MRVTFHVFAFHIFTFHVFTFHVFTFHIFTFHVFTFHVFTFHVFTFHIFTFHVFTFHSLLRSQGLHRIQTAGPPGRIHPGQHAQERGKYNRAHGQAGGDG